MPITSISGPFCSELKRSLTLAAESGQSLITELGQDFILEQEVDPETIACDSGDSVRFCPPDKIRFVNQARTEIVYSDELRRRHGVTPQVHVYYFDAENGGILILPHSTRVSILGSPVAEKIIIDHGGPKTGLIKII